MVVLCKNDLTNAAVHLSAHAERERTMHTSNANITFAFAVLALMSAADGQPVPDPIENHLTAGKNAAGGRDNTPDFYGLVTALCVAPLNSASARRSSAQEEPQSCKHLP